MIKRTRLVKANKRRKNYETLTTAANNFAASLGGTTSTFSAESA
jgi:hypothetical protein